jgi:hypothetical protein
MVGVGVFACLASTVMPARAEDDISRNSLVSKDYRMNPRDVRKYGDYFRDQYLLHATENDGWVDIELTKIDRATGGPVVDTHAPVAEELMEQAWAAGTKGEPEETRGLIRSYEKRVLCRVRAEVVVPAPPNFLKNPGRQYRISFQGGEIAPDYSHVFNVNASDALNEVENEFFELYRRAEGMDREAVFYGMILAMRSLNEAQRLPARVSVSLLNSEIGRYSIQPPYMDKPKPVHLDRFKDLRQAQGLNTEFKTVLSSRPSDGRTRDEKFGRNTDRQAPSSNPVIRSLSNSEQKRFDGGVFKQKTAADYREQNLMEKNDPAHERESLGRRGESLVKQDSSFPAAHTASQDTLELLTGSSVQSAMSAKAANGR